MPLELADNIGFWWYAARNPDQPAVIDPDERVTTFAELVDRVNRLSNFLQGNGLRHGDRLAFILPNGREVVELVLACSQIGVLCLPLNHHLAVAEITYLLQDSDSSAIVAHQLLRTACEQDVRGALGEQQHAAFVLGVAVQRAHQLALR